MSLPTSHRDGQPHAPRALLVALVLTAAVLVVPFSGDETGHVSAQLGLLDDCGGILPDSDCEFELELTDWSEVGEPGTTLNGTVTITNTGGGLDSYVVEISTDNEDWEASVDVSETDDVDEDGTALINITLEIPADAGLDDTTEVNVTVTSQNDEDVSESLIFDARSGQVYAWTFGCDEEVTVQTGSQGRVTLAALNEGNGADGATITATLPAGLQIGDVDDFELEAGAAAERNVTVQVDADVEEGEYPIEWELQSTGAEGITERCTTTLTATNDDVPGNNDDDDEEEEEDTPFPAAFVFLVALGAVLLARRSRQDTA